MLTMGFEDLGCKKCHQNLEENNQHFWFWDELGNRLKSDLYHINGCVSQVWLLLLEPSLSRSSETWLPSMSAQSSLPSATRPAKLNALLSSVTHSQRYSLWAPRVPWVLRNHHNAHPKWKCLISFCPILCCRAGASSPVAAHSTLSPCLMGGRSILVRETMPTSSPVWALVSLPAASHTSLRKFSSLQPK